MYYNNSEPARVYVTLELVEHNKAATERYLQLTYCFVRNAEDRLLSTPAEIWVFGTYRIVARPYFPGLAGLVDDGTLFR